VEGIGRGGGLVGLSRGEVEGYGRREREERIPSSEMNE